MYKTDTFQFDLKKINSKVDSIIGGDNLKHEKTNGSHKKLSKFTNIKAPPISVFNTVLEKEKADLNLKDNIKEYRNTNKNESKGNPKIVLSNKNLKNISRTENLQNLSNKNVVYNHFKDRVLSPDKNIVKLNEVKDHLENRNNENKINSNFKNSINNNLINEEIQSDNLKQQESNKKSDNGSKNKKKNFFFCCF